MASIGDSVVFKGDLSADEDLSIDGNVEGRISLPKHALTIGANGHVTAQIEAQHVIITGHVVGNVTATERCEIRASGVLEGDVRSPRLLVEEGAVLNGTVEMGEKVAESGRAAVAVAESD